MKKLILYYFALFCFVFNSCGKDNDPKPVVVPNEKQLIGYVSTMTPYSFSQLNPSNKFLWEEVLYTSDKQIKSRKWTDDFDSRYRIYDNESFIYDGARIKEKTTGGDLSSTKRHVYIYSGDKLSGIDTYNKDGLLEKYKYTYASGNLPSKMEYWWYYFDSDPIVHEYSYDSRGNLIKDKSIYSTQPGGEYIYEYDLQNNLTKESYHSFKDNKTVVHTSIQYKYNSDLTIAEKVIDPLAAHDTRKYTYTYNEEKQIIRVDISELLNGSNTNYQPIGILNYVYIYE